MFTYAEATYDMITARQKELIAEADRYRLVNSVRKATRRERQRGRAPDRIAGNLAACGPRETVPAR